MNKRRILVIILLALSMKGGETQRIIGDTTSTFIERTEISTDPIKAFLQRMSIATAERKNFIKVFASREVLVLEDFEHIESGDMGIEGCDIKTIYIQYLFQEYNVYWIPIKEETFFYISKGELDHAYEYFCKILSKINTNAPCNATISPPNEVCGNISHIKTSVATSTKHSTLNTSPKTTSTVSATSEDSIVSQTKHLSIDASPTTNSKITSTPSAHSASMEKNSCENCVQVYITAIVSICSFLAGALVSLFVCMFCRSDIFRKRKDNPTHDIVLDSATLTSQETSAYKNVSGVKTYETLNSSPASTADNALTDHVYLGISSNSSFHYKSEVNRSIGKEIQPAQTYENCRRKKEDHVYNTLKCEETSNIYIETKAIESQEHTYTGLSKREADDPHESVNQSSLEESESIDNRTSDGLNYFVLEDEVKGNGTEVTNMPCEVQDHKRKMIEKGDDQFEGNNYFTLEKHDHLNNPVSIIDQHDATKQPDNDNDGPTYHILEKE